MGKFIAKRLGISVIILFFVTLIIYSLFRCMPASYAETKAREMSQKAGARPYDELLAQLNKEYGFDVGVVPGYVKWAGNTLKGNFGDSWQWNMPVTKKFKQVIWFSFILGAISFIIEIFVAIPLGILAARKQYSRTDYAISVFGLIGISLPSFFFIAVIKLIFSMKLGWFDLYGIVGRNHETLSSFGKLVDYAWHLVLPTLTLSIVSIGGLLRYTRTNMLEVLNQDYIRTARAKGLSEKRVINYHAFRNTLIPIITILASSLPGLFTGAMITEQMFQIPGIGYTSYLSILNGDIPFAMFYLTFIAILTLLGNIIADILYAVVDPRVRVH